MTKQIPVSPHQMYRAVEYIDKPTRPPAPSGRVYFMSMYDENAGPAAPCYMKIGFASDVMMRKHSLQTGLPFDIHIEAHFPGTKEDEKELHRRLKKYAYKREWFIDDLEFNDFLDDLLDARILLRVEHGEDYDPTLQECLAYENPEKEFNSFFGLLSKIQRASISEGP